MHVDGIIMVSHSSCPVMEWLPHLDLSLVS